jgi:hypothetical protein
MITVIYKNWLGMGQGFGLVVTAAGWHAGTLGSILGRDGLYTFVCIPPAPWALSGGYVRYSKVLISISFHFGSQVCISSIFT